MRSVLMRPWPLALWAPLAFAQSEPLPGDPFERLDPEVQRTLGALDPLAAGWKSEAQSDATAAQLERIAAFLEHPAEALAGLEPVFTPSFRFRSAGKLREVHSDEVFQVRRPGSDQEPAEEGDRAAFLAYLRRSLEGASEVHAKLEFVRVEAQEGLTTQAFLIAVAERPAGSVQVNSWWECAWEEPADGGAPRLARVRILEHDEISARPAAHHLFSDCSTSVFGATPAWSKQLLPGINAWRRHLDTRLGVPFVSHSAGIAIGDVDGDGLEDLYLCQPGGLPNKLLLHQPDGTVRDASAEAGVDILDFSRSALLVDLDGDGDRDLAVSAAERLLLFANEGRAHFWLQGALDAPDTTSLAAADVDLDGDLDLYACAYGSPYDHSALPMPYHDANNGKPNVLFENRGDWSLVDVTVARGLDQNNRRFSFGAAFEDFDADGDPDLYVANDFGRNNLYRNDGGHFVDTAPAAGVEDISAGMGATWGDYDGDLRFDLYVSNMYSSAGNRVACQSQFQAGASADVREQYQRHAHGSTLFRNRGDGTFEDVTGASPLGVSMGRWAWGALFTDLDNDGWQDLLSPNGFFTGEKTDDLGSLFWRQVVSQSPLEPEFEGEAADAYRSAWMALNRLLRRGYSWSGREQNCAFLNLGGRGFANVSGVTGFDFPDDARALALADWDGDGDQDFFLTNRTSPRLRFLRNDQATTNAHVTLELVGTSSNRDAIGARVELVLAEPGGTERKLLRGVRAGEGYLSQSSSRLTIGLGPAGTAIRAVSVTWPAGAREEFRGVQAGKAWRLVQGSGSAGPLELRRGKPLASSPVAPVPVPSVVRVALVRPIPLPRLSLASADGSEVSLFGIQPGGAGQGTGRPILLSLFSTTCAPCAKELGEFAARSADFERAGLAPLALSVEPAAERARAAEFLRARGWPYPWIVATGETLEVLDALVASVLDTEVRLALPASFLIDANGALRILYLGPAGVAQVLADRPLCDLGEGALFDSASPFLGRWMFPGLPTDADFLERRLRTRGLVAAADEYARGRLVVVRTAPADLLQDFGRRSAVEGRLGEAESYFRRALAADPRHFGALSDWAVVLHRQQKLVEAAELYGKALALEPEDADVRFNLALARFQLGDRAYAEQQLRWLEARGAESAAVLRGVLAAPAAK